MSPRRQHPREQPQASTSAPQPVPETARPPPRPRRERITGCFPKVSTNEVAEMQAVALSVAETLTSVANDVADNFAVPGLKTGLTALATVIRKLQDMQTVVEGVETLRKRVGILVTDLNTLQEHATNQQLPGGMVVRISGLVETWEGISARAEKIQSRGKIMRFLRSSRDAKALSDLVSEINDSIQDKVITQGILNIESYMIDIYRAMKEIRAHLEYSFLPIYAKRAHFDSSNARNACLADTRVDLLHQICRWIISACAYQETVPKGGIVFWINGLGGTGKTTIAYSIAKWCEMRDLLGGTFFCSRFDEECSNPNLIFLTLCRQLSHRHADFKKKVEAVLKKKPDIANSPPHRQFEELILAPLEELGDAFPRFVIVLDALDECRDDNATSIILSVIAKYVERIAPFLLFIVTSRPEQHITAVFEASRQESLHDTTKQFLLHSIPIEIVTEDIKRYLDYEFDRCIGVFSVKKGWPSADEKSRLAALSHGLFIYVATALKFIMDRAYGNPKKRLRLLLNTQLNSSTPHEFLFALYSTIVVASREKAAPELLDTIRNVLGTVVLTREPLSPSAVSSLLGIDEEEVRNALTRFHSVLHVPANSWEPIRVIHPTFVEYLLQPPSPESSEPVPITAILELQPAEQHWHLFLRSIEAMSSVLRRDMIGIRYPAMFRSEVEKLEERVNNAIEPHISYTCRFWSDHLRDGINGVTIPGVPITFLDFVREKLLFWLEVCSLLDALDRAILVLETARNVCQSLGDLAGDLALLLADCRRFVVTYSPCIHAAPLQIYYCTLSIAPTNSVVAKMYAHEREQALIVEHGSPSGWAPCLDVVSGHGGRWLCAVAFSHDGGCFVTGGDDNKATVWKTATRTPIMSFDGHTAGVRCVAYAPDGQHAASGSDDKRVCVWQPSSGECVHTLQGHTDKVYSVAYSGDGCRILSATYEGEVKLWDTTDGRCLLTLGKTDTGTWQVGISHDGGVIARGDGASLSLYNAVSSSTEVLEFPDAVEACVFSPDGRYIAARSRGVIRLWAWPGKSLVRSIDVTEELTSRLAFSHDGTLVGCGSDDGTVLLLSVTSEDSARTLQGHVHSVRELAYSPDKSLAISVARDGVIRVWDLTSSSILTTEHPALDLPSSASDPPRYALIRSGAHAIALLDLPALGIDTEHFAIGAQMPDGAPTATPFSDVVSAWDAALQVVGGWDGSTAAREWELLTGRRHFQPTWRPFAISPDGALMAYLSPTSDSIVDICDLCTGAVVATLTGHANASDVLSIAFSPDKSRLATGSQDGSVKIWDTTTGDFVCGHTEHRDWTRTVTFSPDGRLVASGSHDKTVRIFEIATERVIRMVDSHRDWVTKVMFAEDGIHLMALDDAHWVYIYNVETGARIREVPLRDDGWLHSPFFSPSGTGVLVGDGGAPRTIPLWDPGTHAWPVYYITRDGWVYALSPGKTQRLCWLPPEWRTPLRSEGSMFYVGEGVSGRYGKRRVIVLNMSQLLEYIDALDARQ